MKETDFIEQNKEKWSEFERLSNAKDKDPEKLSDLFIEITNDLSFAKTYFTNRSVKVYLNNLAQKVYTNVYKTRKEHRNRIVKFWKDDLPLIMYESRRELLISFLIVFVCSLIGAFSSYHDDTFAQHILGDQYVEMTKSNIENGDPMGVYKEGDPIAWFIFIAENNLRVAFLTFAMGILFGIGTGFILIRNGVMLGVFQYFFVARGLTQESVLTIWMHGAPEISSIVLAGAAGLTLGRGLLFPNTYNKQEAFIVSARKGITIMLAITPIIIFAAFIESFVTRFTEVPDLLRAFIILSMLGAMLYYFVIYPIRKFKGHDIKALIEDQVPASGQYAVDVSLIKTNGEIYGDVVRLVGKYFNRILMTSLIFGLLYALVLVLVFRGSMNDISYIPYIALPWFFEILIGHFYYVDLFFDFFDYPILYPINALIIGGLASAIACLVKLHLDEKNHRSFMQLFKDHAYKGVVLALVTLPIYFIQAPWPFFIMIFFLPIVISALVMSVMDDDNPLSSLKRIFDRSANYWSLVGLYLIMVLTSFVFFLVLNSSLKYLVIELVGWFLPVQNETYQIVIGAVIALIVLMGITFAAFLLIYAFTLHHYSVKEKVQANSLFELIEEIGKQHKPFNIALKSR